MKNNKRHFGEIKIRKDIYIKDMKITGINIDKFPITTTKAKNRDIKQKK